MSRPCSRAGRLLAAVALCALALVGERTRAQSAVNQQLPSSAPPAVTGTPDTPGTGSPDTTVSAPSGVDPAVPAVPRRRLPAIPSDLLTHSPLVSCEPGAGSGAGLKRALRAATWNIKAARSSSVEALASEMAAMQVDVIALQEVDVRTRRAGFVDQPVELAAALGYHYAFAASIKWDEGDYGLAVLSRWPVVNVSRHRLEGTNVGEPRIILEVVVCAAGRPLRIFNHHADGRPVYRELGFATLRDMVRPEVGQGILVMGDFNDYADAPGLRALVGDGLVDLGAEGNARTIDHGRIDYVLADRPLLTVASTARVWETDKSDHYAVLTDLHW